MAKSDELRERLLEIHELAVSTSFLSTKEGIKLRSLIAHLLFDLGVYLGANPPLVLHLSMPPRNARGQFVGLKARKEVHVD